jgi:hypothetical protein
VLRIATRCGLHAALAPTPDQSRRGRKSLSEWANWRKGRDSNPRGAHHAYAISSRAHSARLCDPSSSCCWRRGWDSNPRGLLTLPLFESGTLNHSDTSPSADCSLPEKTNARRQATLHQLGYARQDLNLRPFGPQPNALSAELRAHDFGSRRPRHRTVKRYHNGGAASTRRMWQASRARRGWGRCAAV